MAPDLRQGPVLNVVSTLVPGRRVAAGDGRREEGGTIAISGLGGALEPLLAWRTAEASFESPDA